MVDVWCKQNPEKCRKAKDRWRNKNRERLRLYAENYRNENPDKVQNQRARWYQDNKEYKDKWHKQHTKKRKVQDINFRLACNLRTRLYNALRGNYKTGSAVSDLGCSIEELKCYLESKFETKMSWENYGSFWEIDHIIPLASFDLTVQKELKKSCHFTNLQPLPVAENRRIRKSAAVWIPINVRRI